MQATSDAYKAYVSRPFIPTPYQIYCLLEVVNQEAQDQGNQLNRELEYYSYFGRSIFIEQAVENRYATCEENYTRVDGMSYFLPEPQEGLLYHYNGAIAQPLSDDEGVIDSSFEIEFMNGLNYDVKGLRVNFGESYPIDFNIEDMSGRILHEYRGNTEPFFKCNDVFYFDNGVVVHALKMNKSHRRFKIEYFEFGMRVEFTNSEVISMTLDESIHPLSTECYSSTVTLKCVNVNDEYNTENPSSTINFLEKQQRMQLWLSIDMDNGVAEEIKVADIDLNEWSSNSKEVTFKATDVFSFMDGIYYKGQFYSNGITGYDLCVAVFQDAGIGDFIIDDYLKTVKFYNPLPNAKHKEVLQYICSASGCVFYQNRSGVPAVAKVTKAFSEGIISNNAFLGDIPTGKKLEQVKQLEVYQSVYATGEKVEQLAKLQCQPGVETIFFSSAAYDVSVTNASILNSGAYYVSVQILSEGEIIVSGKKYTVTKQKQIYDLNQRGIVKSMDNPLISNRPMADILGASVGEYLKADREYDFTCRGRAEYDVMDVVGLENKYDSDLKAMIINHSLTFNGSLKGKIKCKKVTT